MSTTRPATIGPVTGPSGLTSSTSMPMRVNASASSSGVGISSKPRCSTSQLTGMRTGSGLRSEWLGEADIALDHVAHVGQAVAELQRPLEAHAEREAGVDVRVDAAGAQDVGVDHAAAAPLD